MSLAEGVRLGRGAESPRDRGAGRRRFPSPPALPPKEALPLRGWRPLWRPALGVVLAVMAQYSFTAEPSYAWDGLLLATLAAATFAMPLRRRAVVGGEGIFVGLGRAAAARPARTAALGVAVALAAWLLVRLPGAPATGSFAWAWAAWAGAIVACLAATGALTAAPATQRSRPSRRTLATAGGLLVLALLFRLWRLDAIPPTLSGDEAGWGLDVASAAAGTLRNPFTLGWWGHPTLAAFFNLPGLLAFGQETLGLRLPWALVGAATVVPAYLLCSRLAGPTVGLLTGLLVATWGFHIHISRLGIHFAGDGFFAVTALWLLHRALASGSRRAWAGAGLVSGLSLYSYPGARLAPLLVLAVLAARLLPRGAEGWRRHRRGVATLAATGLVAAAPILQQAILRPDDFHSRLNQVGVFQSGWLAAETVHRGQGEAAVLADQFVRAVLAFNHFSDRSSHYGSPEPFLGFAAGALLLLGLGWATRRALHQRLLPMVGWWWAGIAASVLTAPTPFAPRMTTLIVPSAFFVALALSRLAAWVGVATGWPRRRLVAAALAGALAIGAASTWRYFVVYTPSLVFGNPHAVVATALARHLRRVVEPGGRLVFFGAPAMYAGFPTLPFLAPHVSGVDVLESLTAPPPQALACGSEPTVFAFLPERVAELDLVRQAFPGGVLEELSPAPGRPAVVTVYRVRVACPPQEEG